MSRPRAADAPEPSRGEPPGGPARPAEPALARWHLERLRAGVQSLLRAISRPPGAVEPWAS